MPNKTSEWLTYYLFVAMLVSSFVSFEPAPYDLLLVLLMGLGFLLSLYKITKEIMMPIVLICIFLIANLVSLFFVKETGGSLFFSGITFYLALTCIALILIAQQVKGLDYQKILNGYLISACIATVFGSLAYFEFFSIDYDLLMFDRVKAFFKDPNVFGPYLIFPALFTLGMFEIERTNTIKKIVYFIGFLLLGMGIVLSFSRAAWGNFAIALVIYLFSVKKTFIKKRTKTIIILFLIGVPLFMYFIQTPTVGQLFENRLGYQGYDDNRFDTQKIIFNTGLTNPLGIGGGQSDHVVQKSPHNLYARVFTENGLLGFLSVLLLILCSIVKSYKNYWETKSEYSIFYLIIFASLIGLAFNSFFVDSLHWRHFWLILALAWVPNIGFEKKYNRMGS